MKKVRNFSQWWNAYTPYCFYSAESLLIQPTNSYVLTWLILNRHIYSAWNLVFHLPPSFYLLHTLPYFQICFDVSQNLIYLSLSSTYLTIYRSIFYQCTYIYQSIYLPFYMSIYLFIYPYIYLSIYLIYLSLWSPHIQQISVALFKFQQFYFINPFVLVLYF